MHHVLVSTIEIMSWHASNTKLLPELRQVTPNNIINMVCMDAMSKRIAILTIYQC